MYAWGDNDHGQQGNSSTIVNRKPALVHGLEDVFINRVACGSSHSLAWNLQNSQTVSKQEPVIFSIARDPLGSHALGLYDGEKSSITSKNYANSPSLSTIVMSLESSTAKQQALQHILNAMHIQLLRQAIVRALSSHTNVTSADSESLKVTFWLLQSFSQKEPTFLLQYNPDSSSDIPVSFTNNEIPAAHTEIAVGGGEAPVSLQEVSIVNLFDIHTKLFVSTREFILESQ